MDPIRSYDRYFAGESIVRPVSTEDQIRDAFREAKSSRKRVVIRGSGHSFHDQALHDGDKGTAIVLDVSGFQKHLMELRGDQVRLGAGVQWGDYFKHASGLAKGELVPYLMIPASMQTGQKATVGGTLSGDCLSRFSGTMGKESNSIVSFRLLTPQFHDPIEVSLTSDPALFNAVVGGFGYLGFVLDATYKLVALDKGSIARTRITLHKTFADLVQKQVQLVTDYDGQLRAISSAWYTAPRRRAGNEEIKGMVFESWYDLPSVPPKPGFLLYGNIEAETRYWNELFARTEPANTVGHDILYSQAQLFKDFENDLRDFLFFMDGNTIAKERFERETKKLFPIIQQTFVIPEKRTVEFAENCERKLLKYKIRPTESDMLYAKADNCLMSGNYKMDGFAVSFGFELPARKDPGPIQSLLEEMTQDCVNLGGRLHLVKNAYAGNPDAGKALLRKMYGQQIVDFETLKGQYDPCGILQNTFSDKLFNFLTPDPGDCGEPK